MQTHDVPLLPWQTVGSDILEHKIKTILWSLIIIQSTLRHSNSRVKQVKMYAYRCGMQITTIMPTYSRSNGLAERAVHIVKNMLRKGGNLNDGLMEYRNTPISNFPYSPNQMLFSRQVRTQVPVHRIMLVPQVCKDVH